VNLARAAFRKYPRFEFWDVVPKVLEHSLDDFDVDKGRFDRLFMRNLLRRMGRDQRRQSDRESLVGRGIQAHEELVRSRLATAPEREDSFKLWARRLLECALADLDDRDAAYWVMRKDGIDVGRIAQALGMTVGGLKNRYGGKRFETLVRRRMRRVVRDVKADDRRLLARHLVERAGLSGAEVDLLLGVPTRLDDTVPVLEEHCLLKVLGWGR
jgi:hypothetical protein